MVGRDKHQEHPEDTLLFNLTSLSLLAVIQKAPEVHTPGLCSNASCVSCWALHLMFPIMRFPQQYKTNDALNL